MKTLFAFSILLTSFFSVKLPQKRIKQDFDIQKITWNDLKDVHFKKKFNIDLAMFYLYPNFGPKVTMLNGRTIEIKGYTIPIDSEGNYVVSQNPNSMCYFCGKSGTESMIQLKFGGKHQRYKVDEIRTFKGILRLNATNVQELNYILEDAERVD